MTRQTDRLLKLRFRSSQRPLIHHTVQGLAKLGAVLQLPPFAFLGGQSFPGRRGGVFCGLGRERGAELGLDRRKLPQQGGAFFSIVNRKLVDLLPDFRSSQGELD